MVRHKITSLLLLFMMLAPMIGMYSWFHIQRMVIRREVKKQMVKDLPRDKLVLLSFSHAETAKLEWEHSREFEYQDEMYDVVKSTQTADSVHYWCWPDKKETTLNRQLTEWVERSMQTNPQHQQEKEELLRLMKTLFSDNKVFLPLRTFRYLDQGSASSLNHYRSRFLLPEVPPPQLA